MRLSSFRLAHAVFIFIGGTWEILTRFNHPLPCMPLEFYCVPAISRVPRWNFTCTVQVPLVRREWGILPQYMTVLIGSASQDLGWNTAQVSQCSFVSHEGPAVIQIMGTSSPPNALYLGPPRVGIISGASSWLPLALYPSCLTFLCRLPRFRNNKAWAHFTSSASQYSRLHQTTCQFQYEYEY